MTGGAGAVGVPTGTGGRGGTTPGGSTPGGGAAAAAGAITPASGATTAGPASSASFGCPVNPSQCTDGKDNDGDGFVDSADPECSGPCDNHEGTFATGIPGDNIDDLASCKQDCFFDGNSGGEDDGCQFDLRCDPARATARQCRTGAQPPGVRCQDFSMQSGQCRSVCGRLTPNGCDCFGCCQVTGASFGVRLTPTCTAAAVNDPTKCDRCTPQPACLNPCDKCEVCFGKPAPDPSCVPGAPSGAGGAGGTSPNTPPPGACAPGDTYCGPGGTPCSGGAYCLSGCCLIP
jgi:hypothetical protein